MKDVLVIVPFPMSEENLAQRRAQLDAVELSDQLRFTFKSTKAAPRNYVSKADMVLADIGILEVGQLAQDEGFAAVCIDTRTGGIRGIVGGRASGNTSFNRALDARRDLGEIFAPFVYAAAAERGIPPRKGQPVTLGREIGTEDLINLMERFGFRGPFLEGDDLFRGGVSATPLEVAAAGGHHLLLMGPPGCALSILGLGQAAQGS